MSQRVASSEAAGNQDDNVMHRINQLAKLVEQGLLKKSELTGMIKAIYLGTAGAGSPSPPKDSPARRARRYRRPASPETVKVRRIIEDPIERRFQLQCATVDTPLFQAQPGSRQRRLNEPLFDIAVNDPLDAIYINNAKSLHNVPASKVIHIIKWKVRKMRGNLIKNGVAKAGVYHDDGFDWQAAAQTSPSQIVVRPVKTRQYVRVFADSVKSPTANNAKSPTASNAKSAFVPFVPVAKKPTITMMKCGKCGVLSQAFPLDRDWNADGAIPYCKSCYEVLDAQMDSLAAVSKATEKIPKPRSRNKSGKNTREPTRRGTGAKKPTVPSQHNGKRFVNFYISVFFNTIIHV